MKKILFFLFGLLLTPNNVISQNKKLKDQFDLVTTKKILKKEIIKILKDTGIPSISLSIFIEDSIVWSEAFGYTNVKKQVLATSSAIYNTGSNFKFVTATAIMQLAEAGKLNIDDPVNNYLGEFAINDLSSNGTPVTFRHLLSHHSGLKGSQFENISLWDRKGSKPLQKIASELTSEESPGKNFKYSNSSYALLGLLIEKVSGKSYQDYIVEHILKPLQIESEGPVLPTPRMIEELALPYKLENNTSIPEYQSRLDIFPAGDIYLSPTEMAHFYIAQLNEGFYQGISILNPISINEMHKPQFGNNYGFGIGIINSNGTKYLQHAGEVPGFSTFFVANKNSKKGIYIAANAGQSYKVLGEIANLTLKLLKGDKKTKVLPSLAKKEFNQINLTEKELRKYIGKYKIAPEFFINITLQNNRLYGQATGQNKFELFTYEEDRFFLKAVYAQIQFNTENNKITGLTFFQNGKTKGKKIE